MNNDKRPLYISYAGPALLSTPLLNKGSAFSAEERASFNLEGLLPEATETIQEQVVRAYQQYRGFESDMDKHIYLRNIQDTNETLFYRLVQNHISEMMPIIYTRQWVRRVRTSPTFIAVAVACLSLTLTVIVLMTC